MKLEQDVCNGSKRKQIYKCDWLWQTGYYAKTKRKGGRGMREGWEYKKLGESCVIEYGTRVVQKKDGGTIYPVYGGGGETFRMDKYNRENCLVVARFAMSRTCVRYVTGKFFLNDSGLSINAGKELLQSYLNHHILYLNDDIYNLGKGAAQRNLDVKSLRNLIIAIPPLSTQLSIVSELDKINELIRLKKEQLKDYDNLAQSIFYEMFGDPVVNEKGWEKKRLGEVCSEIKYGTSKPACDNGKYKYLRMCNLSYDGYLDLTDIKRIDVSDEEIEKCIVRYGDILFNRTNSHELIGKTCMFDQQEPMVIAGYIIRVRLTKELMPQVLARMFNLASIKKLLRSMASGAVNQANITSKELASIQIPIPSFDLQQHFVKRIELIEQQKAEIKSTIANLETLLASRMQYWFD